jgi:hypothetical protein
MSNHPISAREKALKVNLDPMRYGTFAEIGAGQEVVRWFFQSGGAAGTIAKSMSAYDMKVSDDIYGKCKRYVCRERLETMLDREQSLNTSRLYKVRGDTTAFFSFADTVSARNFHGTNECHGWMGIKFQGAPRQSNNQIIIHVRMLDLENALQQEALGIVGVNLIYGAFFLANEPDRLIESLLHGLSIERIEIDMIEFSGEAFAKVDNRVMSLRLVQLGMTGAAMFAADGSVLQPSEYLHKKAVLIERGRFRPLTHVNVDMLNAALSKFTEDEGLAAAEVAPLMEITMHNLRAQGDIDLNDFVSRAEVLATTGYTVLISDFFEYYRLAAYLSRYTKRRIAVAMGAGSMLDLFDENHYTQLSGGILESFGRLFRNGLKIYVYPLKDRQSGELTTVENLPIPKPLSQLYNYLKACGNIQPLDNINPQYLDIYSHEVLEMIARGQGGWEQFVPDRVAEAIKARGLFGYQGSAPGLLQN